MQKCHSHYRIASLITLHYVLTINLLISQVVANGRSPTRHTANKQPDPPIKEVSENMAQFENDDAKLIGDEVFAGDKFYELDAQDTLKNADKPTMQDLTDAYNARTMELEDSQDIADAGLKAQLGRLIDQAYDRLTGLVGMKKMAVEVQKCYDDTGMGPMKKHLMILGMQSTESAWLLLTRPAYEESKLRKAWEDQAEMMDSKNPSLSSQENLKNAVSAAHGHLNGAYNDLIGYGIVNAIRRANEAESDKILGFKDMVSLQAMPKLQLTETFTKRLGQIQKVRSAIEAEPADTFPRKKEILSMIEETQQKLNKAFTQMVVGTPMQGQMQPTGQIPGQMQPNMGQRPQNMPMADWQNQPMPQQSAAAEQPPLSKPGDSALNCLQHEHECFVPRYELGMSQVCTTTCRELGQDGRDVGNNCADMKAKGYCQTGGYQFIMSKYCAASCRT